MIKNLLEAQAAMRLRNLGEGIGPHEPLVRKNRRKNGLTRSEERVLNVLMEEGHQDTIRRGWPDFGVIIGRRLVCIEVKRGNEAPKPDQQKTHNLLKSVGIPVHVIKGDGNVEAIRNHVRKIFSHFEKDFA